MKPHEMYAAVMVDHILDFVAKTSVLGGDSLTLARDLLAATQATNARLTPSERAVLTAAQALIEERLWEKVRDILSKKDQGTAGGGGGGPEGLD